MSHQAVPPCQRLPQTCLPRTQSSGCSRNGCCVISSTSRCSAQLSRYDRAYSEETHDCYNMNERILKRSAQPNSKVLSQSAMCFIYCYIHCFLTSVTLTVSLTVLHLFGTPYRPRVQRHSYRMPRDNAPGDITVTMYCAQLAQQLTLYPLTHHQQQPVSRSDTLFLEQGLSLL